MHNSKKTNRLLETIYSVAQQHRTMEVC